jgi:mgtE-like transporter
MVTLPALFLATYFVGIPWLTAIVAVLCAVVALVALVASLRSRYPILRRIARESLPVLVIAGTIDVIAGITIEKRFGSFLVYPALLVLVPPFLEDSGALGSILSARMSTKLHLGTLTPGRGSLRSVGEDFLLIYLYAVPVFLLLGVSADIAAWVAGLESPGSIEMIAVAMLAGLLSTTFAVLVGFYGAVAAHRLGLDPDNHGIPIVTSSLDLLGAVALILVIVAVGLT